MTSEYIFSLMFDILYTKYLIVQCSLPLMLPFSCGTIETTKMRREKKPPDCLEKLVYEKKKKKNTEEDNRVKKISLSANNNKLAIYDIPLH